MYNKSLTKLPAREQAPEARRRNFEEVSQATTRLWRGRKPPAASTARIPPA